MILARVVHDFLYEQPNAEARLRTIRTSLGLVGALSMYGLPPAEFVTAHRPDFEQAGVTERALPACTYRWMKLAGAGFGLASARGNSAGLTFAAALTSGAASHTSASLFRRLWTYDSHVAALMLLASLPLPVHDLERRRRASMMIALMQALIGCVYAQAALSKLHNDPQSWLRTGDTLRGSVAILGTPGARKFLNYPKIFPALSIGAVAVEAVVPLAVLGGPSVQRYAGMAALAFHGSTAASMRIPFWHLASLLPAIFIHRNRRERVDEGSPK